MSPFGWNKEAPSTLEIAESAKPPRPPKLTALGVPTLDGMGAIGAGAHAAHEHILTEHIVPRSFAALARVFHIGDLTDIRQPPIGGTG